MYEEILNANLNCVVLCKGFMGRNDEWLGVIATSVHPDFHLSIAPGNTCLAIGP
jgi:hypothetical protein